MGKLHCVHCGNDTYEKRMLWDGMYYYRCSYCAKHADPNDEPCPRCGCKAHERIAFIEKTITITSSEGEDKPKELKSSPFKPEIKMYKCLNCAQYFYTQEFLHYLAIKVFG